MEVNVVLSGDKPQMFGYIWDIIWDILAEDAGAAGSQPGK